MRIRLVAGGLLSSVLAGCDLPLPPVAAVAPTTYHSVSYYDAHPLVRDQTDAWCKNNPGLAVKIPTCDSADTSSIHAWHHQMGWK